MKNVARTKTARPIIIIGAPRSGTNMLRDVLCALPGLGTWPCDEINYIWRHRNLAHATDEFAPQQATPRVQQYIRNCFHRLAKTRQLPRVVEKTCANSLRVEFVDRVIPDAMYVFLVRDGRDAAASAMKRWRASLELPYLLRKARFVPPGDLPYYAARYAMNRANRFLNRERRLGMWGPRFEGLPQLLQHASLAEICAAQWSRCVTKARDELDQLDSDRVIAVKYEDFVARPQTEIARIVEFLKIAATGNQLAAAVEQVSPGSVGASRRQFDEAALAKLAPIMNDTLQRFGYAAIPAARGESPRRESDRRRAA